MEHWVEYAGLFLLAMVCVELYRNGTQNEATLEELRELKWRQLREKDKDPALYRKAGVSSRCIRTVIQTPPGSSTRHDVGS
jgi:hypothetical protein